MLLIGRQPRFRVPRPIQLGVRICVRILIHISVQLLVSARGYLKLQKPAVTHGAARVALSTRRVLVAISPDILLMRILILIRV